MVDWVEERAEKFCRSVRDGTHNSPKSVLNGKKLITSKHMVSGRLDIESAYLISVDDFEEINRRSKVDQWDVLVSMIGTVGEVCLVKEQSDFAIKNIGLFKSVSKDHGLWLYYYMKSPNARKELLSRCRGTTQLYVPLGELRTFPIRYPGDEVVFKRITALLSSLDDKIELNRQMNKTLEAMAQAIFRDWFVDFGPTRRKLEGATAPVEIMGGLVSDAERAQQLADLFPSSLDDNGLPAGWVNRPLLEEALLISGGTPKTDRKNYWDGGIRWASAKDVSQCGATFLLHTERNISEAGLLNSSTKIVPQHATVFVARGATTGRACMFGEAMAMNQTCYALGSRYDRPFYLYNSFETLVGGLVQAAHGSVFDTITTKTLSTVSVVGPCDVCDVFDQTVRPFYLHIQANSEQITTLAATRDLLLPKLMSGEIELRDVEDQLEAAQ